LSDAAKFGEKILIAQVSPVLSSHLLGDSPAAVKVPASRRL
jgi:hypothetical protein